MMGATFIPSRFRSRSMEGHRPNQNHQPPSRFTRWLTSALLHVSKRACRHPIYTIVVMAGLASTQYRALLETSSFFDPEKSLSGPADFSSLLAGSKILRANAETGWKWEVEEHDDGDIQVQQDLALMTLVFPNTVSESADSSTAPPPEHIVLPDNSSALQLPSSPNPLSSLSSDTTLAFAVPSAEAPEFLTTMQEIAPPLKAQQPQESKTGEKEKRMWIMKAVKTTSSQGLVSWIQDTWTEFVDLLKNAETLDIIIMVLGYLSMHLTFIALFLSMRRLGSNFWLATTTLISSCFAFLFGLTVTSKFGVPINVLLLSEGLPFLVVTVGFEKPIVLTKAVLSASLDIRREGAQPRHSQAPLTIQTAVQNAVKSRGFDIVRDYFIEIVILSAGAASGVQGGLRQFCFLGAWILFFDCVLLFTFYTAILTIKLEINRIKRHVALRKALEDDGVSHTVAENVASNNDWPDLNADDGDRPNATARTIFGRAYKANNIPKFKVLMVSGFILVNLLNIVTIPFRADRSPASPAVSGLSSVVGQPPMDPFKVAGSGLDDILQIAKADQKSTRVTILNPIKYELEYPSIHYASPSSASGSVVGSSGSGSAGVGAASSRSLSGSLMDNPYTDHLVHGMSRSVGSLFTSFEDPAVSKWMVAALVLSVVLNGYLFNAARWTIQQPPHSVPPPADREVMDVPSTPRPTAPPTPALSSRPGGTSLPPTPAATEAGSDEGEEEDVARDPNQLRRTLEDCEAMLKDKKAPLLTNEELISLSIRGKIPGYALEKTLGDKTRAVAIRRALVSRTHATRETSTLVENSKLPYKGYNYDLVYGACCENVIGYMPLPLGVAGPIRVDGQNYFIPMATTEGVLVASTSRGCKAINAGGGASTIVTADGMTRGPCVRFDSLVRAGEAKIWLDSDDGQQTMKSAFNSTSRFARLSSMKTVLAGTNVYIRFKATTGDAMGMNMISKGVEHALEVMATDAGFDDMIIVSVSGNFCIDKKPAALNWIDGRGKSVAAEATIPGDIVRNVLKTDVDRLVEMNTRKNLVGSAMAGSLGGFNAHASNIVAAMFIAMGQDPAQVVESSSCITLMSNVEGNLHISVSMPSIEVGTIGGGTILEPQSAMLDLLGVRGAHQTMPGDNARQLARIIAAACLAGELSLCSALEAGHLVKAHMAHNRSQQPSRAGTPSAEKTQASASGLAPMTASGPAPKR